MPANREQHVQFWRSLAERMTQGVPLVEALEVVAGQVADTPYCVTARAMAQQIKSGVSLSEAMSGKPDKFTGVQKALVRAGESGGSLDVAAGRIAEAIEAGDICPPGCEPVAEWHVRFWRLLARMISLGVPVVEALGELRAEVLRGELNGAVAAMRDAIMEGRSFSEAARQFPDLFPAEVYSTLAAAEAEGRLHEALEQVAEAVEAGDLASLAMPDRLDTLDSQSPDRRYVDAVILQAAQQGASDIHIEPGPEGGSRVRLRIDGVMHPFEPPEDVEASEGIPHANVVNRAKVMAGMDVAEHRLLQDGRIEVRISDRPLDLRVNVMPTVRGERVTMRILNPRHVEELELENLGMLADDLERVRRLAHVRHGLIVCAGPAGSGKTTVLYAMLREIQHEGLTVLTVEDPVTYQLDGVSQSEVRPERGLTFARLTRNAFRQDPDIVLVGEVRDLETLQPCAQLALTGHLVLTTLHAHWPAQGLRRMLDMGLEPFLLNDTVSGVISSRLVRRLCTECREPIEPPLEELPPEAAGFVRGLPETSFHRAVGCEECYGTGYRGRAALYEFLVPDESVRRAVARSASVEEIGQAAADARTRTLAQDGLTKAARGITTVAEVYRVLGRTEGSPEG